MARFRLLVFDWDGTLFDSIASIVACTRQTLAELGLPSIAPERVRATVGLGLKETILELSSGSTDPELHRRVIETYRMHWRQEFSRRPILFPDVRPTLAHLHEEGYLLAVATGKSRRGLDNDLAAAGIGDYFDGTRTVDEAPSKPSPQMLLDLMDELGARGSETLMIGDTSYDLLMAKHAGCASVGVLTGGHGRDELATASPLTLLEHLGELLAWLGEEEIGRRGGRSLQSLG
ncbi:MAG TPA: HAD-IA family hydrolase [Thermoanaerobaculia bacterium]|nr:HAD-IA family hydrolase [Thermoanaerobaculia bacterium]